MDNPSAEHQATDLTIRVADGGEGMADRYCWVRSVASINMTGWNTLWVRGEGWNNWDTYGLHESFATNAGVALGCPWNYNGYWHDSYAYFGSTSGPGGSDEYIEYTRNGDWWIATKSELKRCDTMSGEWLLCVSNRGMSTSGHYPPLQPTLYWRLGL